MFTSYEPNTKFRDNYSRLKLIMMYNIIHIVCKVSSYVINLIEEI